MEIELTMEDLERIESALEQRFNLLSETQFAEGYESTITKMDLISGNLKDDKITIKIPD